MQRKLKILAVPILLYCGVVNAAIINLIDNSSATIGGTTTVTGASGNAFFAKGGTSGTGSGNFGTFLRFQANGDEEGVSSSFGAPSSSQYDNKLGKHTYSPLISDLTIFDKETNDNVNFDYFKLSLDLNEAGNEREISIQDISLWTADNENVRTNRFGSGSNGEKLVWQLDGPGKNLRIDLEEQGGGSGNSDYIALFDAALLSSGTYFYLYNHFGRVGTNGFSSSGGFEEWGAAHLSPVPVPASVWLFGTALIGFIGFSSRTKV